MTNTRQIKMFIGAIIAAAIGTAGFAGATSHTLHLYLAVGVLVLSAATSRMRVKLPGITGNMSMNLPFLLTAVVNLSGVEAVLIAGVSTAVQCWPRKNGKFNPQQMAFNLSMMSFASASASLVYHAVWPSHLQWATTTLALILAAATLFLGQTVPVAGIVATSEHKSAWQTWRNLALLSFPYYVVSAGITSMVQAVSLHLGWGLALGAFPVMYVIHRSYRLYFDGMAEALRPEVLVRATSAGA